MGKTLVLYRSDEMRLLELLRCSPCSVRAVSSAHDPRRAGARAREAVPRLRGQHPRGAAIGVLGSWVRRRSDGAWQAAQAARQALAKLAEMRDTWLRNAFGGGSSSSVSSDTLAKFACRGRRG